ncbi:hypothetical protein BGZ60DRAFT_569492 [Tricladium varicosporioides]|nr:hypothetical protein BGZ60DRAFT_569492 [Hymenoscyphus varicosporioides]
MPANEARVTQRAPQSCQRCSAKKMRCSKTVPCTSCEKLGIGSQCCREPVIVSKEIRQRSQNTAGKRVAKSKTHRGRQQFHQHETPPCRDERSQYNRHLSPSSNVATGAPQQLTHTQSPCNIASSIINQEDGASEDLFVDHAARHTYPGASPVQIRSPNARLVQPSCFAPHVSASTYADDVLAENAATTLEFLAWGRQRDIGLSPSSTTISPRTPSDLDILSRYQAKLVLDYHREWLIWMHNTVHWPAFQTECRAFWRDGVVEERAWLAVYYALLCVGLNHMSVAHQQSIGIELGECLTRRLYHRAVAALYDADFMSVHSIRSIQAICIVSLCAHNFDGSNLLAVLFSCAIRIAQALNIHRLGLDSPGLTSIEKSQREVQKSIWLFLTIQDWFMIPFGNAFSIYPTHCTTSLPTNCDGIAGGSSPTNEFLPLPIDFPTHMSYNLIMYKVADIYRSFFEGSCRIVPDVGKSALREVYDEVLAADRKLKAVIKSLPPYLQRDHIGGNEFPLPIIWQRRSFGISMAHKTIMIHRSFFLRSLTDMWFTYTRITCVESARRILEEYHISSVWDMPNDLWTVVAHVVSASIILLLSIIFSEDALHSEISHDRQLISSCLSTLTKSSTASSISARGMGLIKILLELEQNDVPGSDKTLDLRQIAAKLQGDESAASMAIETQLAETFDSRNWEDFMQNFDFTFDGTFTNF